MKTKRFSTKTSWNVGDLWESTRGNIFKVISVSNDGCAMLVIDNTTKPMKQKLVPAGWRLWRSARSAKSISNSLT